MVKRQSNGTNFEVEKQEDGGLVVNISPKSSLVGKKAVFSIRKSVKVKDSRPVHGEKKLFEEKFVLKASNNFLIPPSVMKKVTPFFPYSGSKISVLFIAGIELIKDPIFSEDKAQIEAQGYLPLLTISLSNFVSTDFPLRAKVKANAPELLDPKDTFKFFKNLISIPGHEQLKTLTILLGGGASALYNLYVGYHDQMVPEAMTWFYSHYDSDGDSSPPLLKALGISGCIVSLIWLGLKKQLRKYMTFHFKKKLSKIDRSSTLIVGELISGQSRVDLFDATLRIVACNLEKGQYVRGYGSNRRIVDFSHPNRAVLLYSKKVPVITKGEEVGSQFMDEVSFRPMFESLYPRQMASNTHGLDLAWEIQLLVDDFIDQELHGNPDSFVQKEFYAA